MRRADIAGTPPISGGPDYISTLPDQRARGRRLVAAINLPEGSNCYLGQKAQVVTGSLRKFVSELGQQMRVDQPRQSIHAFRSYPDSPIRFVPVQRAFDSPLFPEEAQKQNLAVDVELLGFQIHRAP